MTQQHDPGKRHAPDLSGADRARDARYRLRGWLWDHTSDSLGLRVQSCGRRRVAQYVTLRGGNGAAGMTGVSTCSSVWACPVCSAKVAGTRAGEVENTIRAWRATGGSVVFATFTLSHSREHALADSWDAVQEGWAAVRNGSGWKADQRDFGIAGYVRVVEVTHGNKSGWHPHAHVLLFVTGTPTDDDCTRLRGRLFGRWSARLADLGYSTLEVDSKGHAVGVDVRVARAHEDEYVAAYVTKFGYIPRGDADDSGAGWTIAREVARGDLKSGRKGSRTPWELLEDAAEGNLRARRLWHVWEAASKGRRQYSWANGFRESLGLDRIVTDDAAAKAADEGIAPVALVRPEGWNLLVQDMRRRVARPGMPLLTRALSLAAAGDREAVWDFLSAHGIAFDLPQHAVDQSTGLLDGTPDDYSPALLPGRSSVTHNYADQMRRESRAVPASERTVAYPCSCCGLALAPGLRSAGVHPGCVRDDAEEAWRDQSQRLAPVARTPYAQAPSAALELRARYQRLADAAELL